MKIAKDLALPNDLILETIAIHGVRGTGKTVTATVIVEEAIDARYPVCVIDPTDVWWGLRSSATGKSAGLPVAVLGGPHGDLPLTEHDGPAIADFVVEHRAPVVLSLRHLRKAAQRRFVADFLEQLYHRKGAPEHRDPLLLVIDEASSFVPQRVDAGETRMVGAVEDIVRRGRASGFGVVLVDQRPASVNKNVLTQLQVLICHQITSPQDRKALDEWISQNDSMGVRAEFLAQLSSLKKGEAFFWAPRSDVFQRVRVRMRSTFDSSKTPKLGESVPPPKRIADVDLEQLRERMSTSIEKAAADDPKALRRRIAELEKELRTATKAGGEEAEAAAAAVEAQRDEVLRVSMSVRTTLARVREVANGVHTDLDLLEERLVQMGSIAPPQKQVHARAAPPKPSPIPKRSNGNGTEPGVSGPQQRIIDVLADFELLGVSRLPRSVVAVMAGVSPKSSGFGNNLGALRSQHGLIDYPAGGMVALTEIGRREARPSDGPMTLPEVHEAWFSRVSGPQASILRALTDVYPSMVARSELAEIVGVSEKSSGYGNNLGGLRSLGAIDYPQPGYVAATDLLFPAGVK